MDGHKKRIHNLLMSREILKKLKGIKCLIKKEQKECVMIYLIFINTIIFLLLSILHFYWAFGGKRWFVDTLPTSSSGEKKLNPGMMAGLVIGIGLLFFAIIMIGNQGLFDKYISERIFHYGTLIIAVIFLLRAIGDFKYIGLFKKIKQTKFAINDTKVYSPLCLFISVVSLMIFILSAGKM